CPRLADPSAATMRQFTNSHWNAAADRRRLRYPRRLSSLMSLARSAAATDAAGRKPTPSAGLTAGDCGLYGATVLVWGFSWSDVKLQLGTVAPEVSVFWAFVLAAAVMMGFAGVTKVRLGFPLAAPLRFAGLGALLFSTNFT